MSIRVCSEGAVHGFFIESSLKMITLKTIEKAEDGIGSALCPIVFFHISSSKSSGFTNRVSVIIRQSFSEGKYLKT
jgi:hypothetical protein